MNRTIQKQNIQDRERFAANIDNKGRLIRAAGAIVIGATAILVWSASTTAGACHAQRNQCNHTRCEAKDFSPARGSSSAGNVQDRNEGI